MPKPSPFAFQPVPELAAGGDGEEERRRLTLQWWHLQTLPCRHTQLPLQVSHTAPHQHHQPLSHCSQARHNHSHFTATALVNPAAENKNCLNSNREIMPTGPWRGGVPVWEGEVETVTHDGSRDEVLAAAETVKRDGGEGEVGGSAVSLVPYRPLSLSAEDEK